MTEPLKDLADRIAKDDAQTWSAADNRYVRWLHDDDLRRLLQAARDLEELVAALPKCSMPALDGKPACRAIATRCDSNEFDVCDDNEHGAFQERDGFDYDLPWSPIIRRLRDG